MDKLNPAALLWITVNIAPHIFTCTHKVVTRLPAITRHECKIKTDPISIKCFIFYE